MQKSINYATLYYLLAINLAISVYLWPCRHNISAGIHAKRAQFFPLFFFCGHYMGKKNFDLWKIPAGTSTSQKNIKNLYFYLYKLFCKSTEVFLCNKLHIVENDCLLCLFSIVSSENQDTLSSQKERIKICDTNILLGQDSN